MNAERLIRRIDAILRRLEELTQAAHESPTEPPATTTVFENVCASLEELNAAWGQLRRESEELSPALPSNEADLRDYRHVTEFAPFGYLVTDLHGVVQQANAAARALLGTTQGDLLGKPLAGFISEDHLANFNGLLAPFEEREKEHARLGIRMTTEGGKAFDADLTVSSARDGKGRPVSLCWTLADTSRGEGLDPALQRGDHQFRDLFQDLPVPMLITRVGDGTILYANRLCEKALGLAADRSVGSKRVQDYLDAQDSQLLMDKLSEQGAVQGLVTQGKREDGTPFRAVVSARLLSFDGEEAVLTGLQDITEHERSQAGARRPLAQTKHQRDETEESGTGVELERDLLHAIMENTDAQLAYLDREFNFVRVNSAYATGAGYTKEELIGRNHFQLFPHDENQAIFERVRDTGEPVRFEAKPFVYPGRPELGTTYWDWTLIPITVRTGEVQGLVLSLVDVTERERTLAQLERERARLKAIIDTAPEGIVVADEECRILMTNPAADELYARPVPYGEGWESHETLSLSHPDGTPYAARDLPLTRSALDGERCIGVEMAITWPDGQIRDLLVSSAPIRAADGTITGSVGILQDITERNRMQDALRRYADRLHLLREIDQLILTAPPLAEIIETALSRVRRMVPCLRASVSVFHLEAEELSLLGADTAGETQVGRDWRGSLECVWFMDQLRQGKTHVTEDIRTVTYASPLRDLLQAEGVRAYTSVPIMAQGILMGSLDVGTDSAGSLVPEQQEMLHEVAEQLAIAIQQARLRQRLQRHTDELEVLVTQRTEELRASEAKFRAIFEGTAIGVALLDVRGRVMESNPALQNMLGHSAEELRGIPFTEFTHPDDVQTDMAQYQKFMKGTADSVRGERRYVRSDGDVLWTHVTLSATGAESGEGRAAIAVVEDITEKREAQTALIQAEKLAIAGKLAASLAHEINNPLQSVIGCLGLAQESLAGGGEIERYLQVGLEELRRARDVVARLRDMQRPSDPVETKPTDVKLLLQKALTLTRKRCQERNVEVIFHPEDDLSPVMVVPDRMQQVFLNLILNAIEAMPQGGKLRVAATSTMDPEGIDVSFTDNGVGIATDVMPRLFEPFVTTKEDGLGLGLHVSQNIVDEHGGRIDLDSKPGEGTTFTVWLPC